MVEAILGWLKLLQGVMFFSFSCRSSCVVTLG